ncbi:MAG: hypothetical protein ACLUD2_15495 [Clostridium sp.]
MNVVSIRERWMGDIFTKTICAAKNRNQLMKAVTIAEGLGLQEGKDFFLIKDCCLTELEPEEIGEDGVGRTLTCIRFRPLPDDIAHAIKQKISAVQVKKQAAVALAQRQFPYPLFP